MTDYTKSTNFTSKDSLSTGNALKIVKGAEFDTEFNAIATAVATKADLNSPTFIGTPAAPTASVGTNTTQLATAALVFAAMQALYPVGSVYSNVSVSTNPATLFGFGTWSAITGRMVIGLDSGNTAIDTVGETGGSADAIVVSHTHTVTDPGHTHGIIGASGERDPATANTYVRTTSGSATASESATTGVSINSTGSSATNANLPPYVVAYVWKRTA
ncbi:hypothetical protein UFOVP176_8 [uncultured Caudovirales phage]|uniref:Baseplate structural protein Gp10 C-terminal domain-containing protein n=1 Tax=uncultured Caudovirales phage TaxID=2100421 RepID=A0A6J7WEL6_9CAUD|nr:hypothetical protein UFOVP176_8 [uncultured Caudovirales phage]